MAATEVSTHSRLKAAGKPLLQPRRCKDCFNTQPPEGGWFLETILRALLVRFQHTAA